MTPYTKIGCEAYIMRSGKLLMSKRGKKHGQGTWALPGGHLEFHERADACIIRELQEELGLEISPTSVKLLAVTDGLNPEAGTHYIHITFAVDIGAQEPTNLEPEECHGLQWFDPDKLPPNIYPPHSKILATIAAKTVYV